MSGYNIRLSSMLTFDEEKESDIIQVVEKLNSMHKTGNFLSNLIRVSLDCPEILDQSNGKFSKGSTLVDLEQYGITYNRRALADKNAREITEMKNKVDEMYLMVTKLYTLALMNKHIGLEEKTENAMMATFMVERQLEDLKKTLGVHLMDNTFASNKVQDTKKIAEDSLEFILETYSDIVGGIKSKVQSQNDNSELLNMVASLIAKQSEQAIATKEIGMQSEAPQVLVQNHVEKQEPVKVTEIKTVEEESQDEVIDFGNDGLGMLGAFFGD